MDIYDYFGMAAVAFGGLVFCAFVWASIEEILNRPTKRNNQQAKETCETIEASNEANGRADVDGWQLAPGTTFGHENPWWYW